MDTENVTESRAYAGATVGSTMVGELSLNGSHHEEVDLGAWRQIRYVVGVFMAVILVTTLAGNCLVVLAVVNFRRLRTVTNYLIVSLATADITVSVFVMPYAILYDMLQTWRFGWIFCYFFNSCDVMCCTSSILHLCLISLDRYFAITDPLHYTRRMSKKRTIIMIAFAWICSALISFIPIYSGWFVADGSTYMIDSPDCSLSVNRVYAVVSASTSFYIPLFVMVFAYFRIFRIARQQAREIAKQERSLTQFQNGSNKKKYKAVHRESKAIRTLGTIMAIFIISWSPFFIMYLTLPFCESCSLPRAAVSGITWLGYANSFMNPLVYALLNKDFSMAFKRLLYCNRRSNQDLDSTVKRFRLDRRNGQLEDSYSSVTKNKKESSEDLRLNHPD